VVGKRAVRGGTTRVRRYVVETSVEELVSLRDEKVTLERRPVTDGRPAAAADFTLLVAGFCLRQLGEDDRSVEVMGLLF
jgi:hypothetical protein